MCAENTRFSMAIASVMVAITDARAFSMNKISNKRKVFIVRNSRKVFRQSRGLRMESKTWKRSLILRVLMAKPQLRIPAFSYVWCNSLFDSNFGCCDRVVSFQTRFFQGSATFSVMFSTGERILLLFLIFYRDVVASHLWSAYIILIYYI